VGIKGLHADFVVVDEAADYTPRTWPRVPFGRGLGKGGPEMACPACQAGDHSSCWQHDPPVGVPFLVCPCKVPSTGPGPRFLVTAGSCPMGNRFVVRAGYVIFDKLGHVTVVGWFGARLAAESMAATMNGPSAAEIAEARADLAAMIESL
jgi:hypothetical protein